MKDPLERTKVVIRHLPPSLSHSDLFHHIHDRFAGRFNWSYYRPGKTRFPPFFSILHKITLPNWVFTFMLLSCPPSIFRNLDVL